MTTTELPVDFSEVVPPTTHYVGDKPYLVRHRPARSQFRTGRRTDQGPIRPLIVAHTGESGTDTAGEDPKAENVARFIRRRSTAGSYHLVGDADSIIQLVRFADEAFHDGTGSNRWSIGISLAMNAADWPKLTPKRRGDFINTAAHMAAMAAAWLVGQGYAPPDPVLLTKAESNQRGASGFISHGRRDPSRRSDPGPLFPWSAFLDRYEQVALEDPYFLGIRSLAVEVKGTPDPERAYIEEMQRILGVEDDGIVGPVTFGALEALDSRADQMAENQANARRAAEEAVGWLS